MNQLPEANVSGDFGGVQQLEQFKVKDSLVPDTIYYIPNFITCEEEERLIENVVAAPKPKWTYLKNRSLQNWGGLPHPKGMVPEELPSWLKIYTKKLADLDLFEGKEPNHILMNRYEAGQGIMAHEDGPLFYPTVTTINTGSHAVLNFYTKPKESSSSKEESTESSRTYVFSLLLWPRSLLVLRHDAYTSYLHEIEELSSDTVSRMAQTGDTGAKYFANLDRIPADELNKYKDNCDSESWSIPRETRYSFTIRLVPKVLKVNLQQLLFNSLKK